MSEDETSQKEARNQQRPKQTQMHSQPPAEPLDFLPKCPSHTANISAWGQKRDNIFPVDGTKVQRPDIVEGSACRVLPHSPHGQPSFRDRYIGSNAGKKLGKRPKTVRTLNGQRRWVA